MNPRLFPMLWEYSTFSITEPARQNSRPICRIAMYYRNMMSQ